MRSIRHAQRRFPFDLGTAFKLVAVGAFAVLLGANLAATQRSAGAPEDESAFLAENELAMNTMMKEMNVAPSGDVDRDFVAMMVPHHQGAIDMAQALLRHGHNEKLRRMAQEIIVTQQQEIATMRLALGDPLPVSRPSPTGKPGDDGSSPPSTLPSEAAHAHHHSH